ncbi:hypothetical protein EMCRGX_G023202 [Ephydatia muelleri]
MGAVLEQDQHVVGYASRTLTKAEANYSVIQCECLAIVWAMKQFRHYLLGRTFQLMTDHAPLQWLGEQKMEGLLCRWALAIQECSFEIVYRKGTTNGNADTLSRRRGPDRETLHAALTTVHAGFTAEEIRQAPQQDKKTLQLYNALHSEQRPPHRDLKKTPLRRYAQLWSQLDMVDGIVCRKYHSGPTSDTLVVPVLPEALHQQALSMCHDSQAAGHQGTHKTLERIRREAYWANMAQNVGQALQGVCHMPEVQAANASEVTTHKHPYWMTMADDCDRHPGSAYARPLPDQTAIRVTAEQVKLFCTYGIPEIVHSDQGRNFESSIIQSTLDAFGVQKSHTTPYHPQGDGMVERFNRSLLQLLQTYVEKQEDLEQHLPLALYVYRTAMHTSTGMSSFQLMYMYGRHPQPNTLTSSRGYEATSYQAVLQAKMAELQELVEAHIVESAHRQKVDYDRHSAERPFKPGDLVWLSIPTAGKLIHDGRGTGQ